MPKKLKKDLYTFIEVGAMLFDSYPGHYSNLKSAIATVNTCARELGIGDVNGKKSYRKMTARDAERVLASCADAMRQFTATPLERALRDADDDADAVIEKAVEDLRATADKMSVKAPITYTAEEVSKPLTETAIAKMTVTEKKAEADAFEVRRKKFYTDVNYFIKFAQSPEERLAIWDAIAKLYGINLSAGA